MLTNHTAYTYEIPFKGPLLITHYFTNGMVNLQCGRKKIRYNVHRIKPYKSDTKVEGFNSKNVSDDVSIQSTVIYFRMNH